jgi:hypothetical protein
MKSMIHAAVMCVLAVIACREAVAADAGPLLAKPGKLMFQDDFGRSEMKPRWKVGKGFWSIKEGVVSAAENPDDHHGAYSYIDPNIAYKDVVAEFSFKLDGAKSLQLNLRDSNYKGSHAGHILRAAILPGQVQVVDMKLGGMKNEYYEKNKDPKTTAAERHEINEKIKDKSATFKAEFDLSMWHQARVEVAGDEMLISIDGKPEGYIKSEGIDHATKNMLGFTIGGKSAEIKDVKFYEASQASGWNSARADVVGSLKK